MSRVAADAGSWIIPLFILIMLVAQVIRKKKAAGKAEEIAEKLQQKAIELDKARHKSFSVVKDMKPEKEGIEPYRMRDVSFTGVKEETPLAAKRKADRLNMRTFRNLDGTVLEDDEHDWLAEQLREEERAYRRVSAMFQLKMSHAMNCNADRLRYEHENNCAAEQLRRDCRQ